MEGRYLLQSALHDKENRDPAKPNLTGRDALVHPLHRSEPSQPALVLVEVRAEHGPARAVHALPRAALSH